MLRTNLDGTNISVLIIEVGVYVFIDVGVTEGHVLYNFTVLYLISLQFIIKTFF